MIFNFAKRSCQKEFLDRDDIPFEDIKQNMKELDFINKYLGGHSITVRGFKKMIGQIRKRNKRISVCEIGCGGGDNLRAIKNHCRRKNIPVNLSGIDINPHCTEFARSREENRGIEFIASDYKNVSFNEQPHIIFCSLFCHHFTDKEVVEIIKWMKENSRVGFFINDLHRHPFAYYSIKWLTKIFSKSYMVKNDAPLSVLKGFKKNELQGFSDLCHASNAQLKWKWAFRWLMTYSHE